MTSTLLPANPPGVTEHAPRWALPILLSGTVMIVLDFFVVNVALPSMQQRLHAGTAALEWVVAGYGLTFAALMVTAGRLGDRFGRRRVFVWGLVLFGITSALCGLAPDPAVLVAARCLQGAAGALISPTVLSLIGVMFQGPDRVRAISVYGLAMGVAAAGGQLLGGVLLQADIAGSGWRTIFLINVPIAVWAAVAARRVIPESRAEQPPGLDPTGVVLVTAGLVALVLPLVQGRELGWPAWTWASLALAPVILAGFVRHQHRTERSGGTPLLAPSLFAARQLRAGLATQLGFWCGQAALFLVVALYLQDGRGLDPLQAGLVFTILAAAYLVASVKAPALTLRFGRDLVGLGALLLAAGEGGLAAGVAAGGTHCPLVALVPGLLAAGAGMGLCITPLTTVVLAHADPERAGAVSGALSTMQQVGNAVGVAVTGMIFFGNAAHGAGRAFTLSALELAALLVGVAGLSRLLPSRRSLA
ncbi:MAG TPA: MFS transporter [Acidimicrobiales bacterium]|nr:MFS transporter [Acidimicrobiales bacterium]